MSHVLYLPTSNDWKLLDKVYGQLNRFADTSVEHILEHKKVFGFVAPFYEFTKDTNLYVPNLTDQYAKLSRLMLYLARYFWDKCPLPILTIANDPNERFHFLGYYEDLSHVFGRGGTTEFNRTSITRFLNKLEAEGLINSITYKKWLIKYGLGATIEKDYQDFFTRSSTKIFPLTAIGTIMYEYIINTPSIFQSYLSAYFEPDLVSKNDVNNLSRSQNRYNTAIAPLIALSIATRKERLSLFVDSPFHFKESKNHEFNDYHEEIFNQQSELLGSNREFFIEMHNPATKILREIRALYELENFFKISRSSRITPKNFTSEDLLERLVKIKFQGDIKMLEEMWVNLLGLDLTLIKKYLPDIPI